MRTLQKIIWILFLIFGINSCTDIHELDGTIHFMYYNNTSEIVELKMVDINGTNFKDFTIPVGSSFHIPLKQNRGKGVGIPFLFDDGQYAEKVIINFETSNKCLIDYYKIKESKYYDNYSTKMLDSYDNTLIYYIDKEELYLAEDCL